MVLAEKVYLIRTNRMTYYGLVTLLLLKQFLHGSVVV